jgi:dipeptidyl aminopeptidase/acylaminoacyl peptidase
LNVTGFFSADGQHFVYPVLTSGAAGTTVYTHLQMLNLTSLEITALSPEAAPLEDTRIAFHPDGKQAALIRRYFDENFTTGGQVYLLNLDTLNVLPLVVDAGYSNSEIHWSSDGRYLTIQRFQFDGELNPEMTTEIWVYDTQASALQKIVDDAYMPMFIPERK